MVRITKIANTLSVRLVVVASSLITLLGLLVLTIYRFFDHDEFEAVHTSWLLYQGDQPYIDFIQHHHLLMHYALTPLFRLLGETTQVLLVGRGLMYLCLLAAVFLTYRLALELFQDRLIGALSALFLTLFSLFTAKALEIRPDVPQTLLCLLGLVLIMRHARVKQTWLLIASGVSFGLALLVLQKAAIPIGLVGLIAIARVLGKKMTWAELGLLILAGFLTLVPGVIFIAINHGLDAYWLWNVTYNRVYYDLRGPEPHKLINNLQKLLVLNGLLIGFAVATPFYSRNRAIWELIFFTSGVFGFAILSGRHNPQYYMPAFPVLAVLAAYSFSKVLRSRRIVAYGLLALIVGIPNLYNVRLLGTTNEGRLEKIRYVAAVVPPGERVYDGNILFNLFRRDVDFLWYMVVPPYKAAETLAILNNYSYDVYKAIEKYEPKVIAAYNPVTGIPYLDKTRAYITENYRPSQVYEGLYLRNDETTLERENRYIARN